MVHCDYAKTTPCKNHVPLSNGTYNKANYFYNFGAQRPSIKLIHLHLYIAAIKFTSKNHNHDLTQDPNPNEGQILLIEKERGVVGFRARAQGWRQRIQRGNAKAGERVSLGKLQATQVNYERIILGKASF